MRPLRPMLTLLRMLSMEMGFGFRAEFAIKLMAMVKTSLIW